MLAPHRILDIVEPAIAENQLRVVYEFFQVCILATLQFLSHGSQICHNEKKKVPLALVKRKRGFLDRKEEGRTHGLFNHVVVICRVRCFYGFTKWP